VFFAVFMALLVIFFNFLRLNLPKLSQHIASSRTRILSTKKVRVCKGSFFRFFQIYDFQSKIVTNSLPNITEFHRRKRRKLIVSFAFDVISKNTDVFLRPRAHYLSNNSPRGTDRKTISRINYEILSSISIFCQTQSFILADPPYEKRHGCSTT